MIHEESQEMSLLSKPAHVIPYVTLCTYLLYFNNNQDFYFHSGVEVGPISQSQIETAPQVTMHTAH